MLSVAARLASAARPAISVVRRAAPRFALVVLAAQLLGGVISTLALLLTTDVLRTLLASSTDLQRLEHAMPSLLLLGGLLASRLALDGAASVGAAHLAPKVRRVAEESLFRSTLSVDLAAFDDPRFYDQLQRARDRGLLHLEGVTTSLVEMLSALVAVVGAIVALIVLHPLLALLLTLSIAPEAWAALSAARLQHASMATTISLMRQVTMLAELATQRESAPEIRANQTQNYLIDEYRRCAAALQNHQVSLSLQESWRLMTGRTLSGAGLIGTFVTLALMVRGQWVDLAVAGAAVIAIRNSSAALKSLMLLANDVFEKALYIADYQSFLDQAERFARPAAGPLAPTTPGCITLDHVSFRYPGADSRMALSDVSLSIVPGQTVALVGENGSGKTTLAKVIAGLYQPSVGAVRWDGHDTSAMSPESLADRVVMVMQHPVRWPRSARENVRIGRYARSDPTDEALREVARQSRADEVVERLPRGWDTLLSQQFHGGQDLSAGQWQRLAVARGLYRDAPLVIWDEPTAPLDAKAEYAVYESLRKLAQNRTVILITHRLASIRKADHIFFLERGALVEQGTHDDLMKTDGRYAELYHLQAKLHGFEGA